jgi:oxygen-independent coproporphyrinogen-3 oxidase
MTSLRTIEGVDLKLVESNFSIKHRKRIESTANDYIKRKLIIIKKENFVLTEKGKLFADGIVADLFV